MESDKETDQRMHDQVAATKGEPTDIHVVTFATPGIGHITPVLQLSQRLLTENPYVRVHLTAVIFVVKEDRHKIVFTPNDRLNVYIEELPPMPFLQSFLRFMVDADYAKAAIKRGIAEAPSAWPKPSAFIAECFAPWSKVAAAELKLPMWGFNASPLTMAWTMLHGQYLQEEGFRDRCELVMPGVGSVTCKDFPMNKQFGWLSKIFMYNGHNMHQANGVLVNDMSEFYDPKFVAQIHPADKSAEIIIHDHSLDPEAQETKQEGSEQEGPEQDAAEGEAPQGKVTRTGPQQGDSENEGQLQTPPPELNTEDQPPATVEPTTQVPGNDADQEGNTLGKRGDGAKVGAGEKTALGRQDAEAMKAFTEEMEKMVAKLLTDVQAALEVKLPSADEWGMHAIGPLAEFDARRIPGSGCDDVIRWLDHQAEKEVVFVCLGSWCELSAGDLYELAVGLEMLNKPVLWALREPVAEVTAFLAGPGRPAGGEVDSLGLPVGYKERNSHVKIVKWVDQPAVLAHPAVGAFLTHCGWNSSIEALSLLRGPLVLLPLAAEQLLNARVLEKCLQVGERLWESRQTTALQRQQVCDKIKGILANKEYRLNAEKWGSICTGAHQTNGPANQALLKFWQSLRNNALKNFS